MNTIDCQSCAERELVEKNGTIPLCDTCPNVAKMITFLNGIRLDTKTIAKIVKTFKNHPRERIILKPEHKSDS